ncbi:hypothetical protein EQG49_11250 [Periweissella cryptocerci]|uniref:Uncharacterized protein n=1 Tax=Periweissella cryptocerci TaxID=2506420 RepID=A0A4P6YW42_9LACO|nr:hypothetical protein [Periweissella cryptocerci]QBO36983.1 hypothetical protein EQG49_11250 [Periweissella cryptocerci]
MNDTGWINVTPNAPFTAGYLQYKRRGKTVMLRGQLNITSAQSAGWTGTIFTLPAGFRPTIGSYYSPRFQGSDANSWLMPINTAGVVSFERYGSGSNVAIAANAWLVFTAQFELD